MKIFQMLNRISFFGFNDLGHMSCNVVDPEMALLFLKNEDHVLLELSVLENDKLVFLHKGDYENTWLKGKTAPDIFEAGSNAEIAGIDISLIGGGQINFEMGDLYINIPDHEFLIAQTLKLLEVYGYYCGRSIIKFCLENRGKHCIEPLIGYHDDDFYINEKFDIILRGD